MARPTRNAHELWALICQRGMMKAVFMFRPAYLYKEEDVEQAVTSVKERFGDDVESVRYSVRDDWSDDPAIFFRILLKDKPGMMNNVTLDDPRLQDAFDLSNRISSAIRSAVGRSHLPVYFAFRWVSEQVALRDPDWE